MKKLIPLFSLLLILGCQNEKEFKWTESLRQTIGDDLNEWLKKSPFEGEWSLEKDTKETIVIDNREQVFPFMGNFKNENNNYKDYSYKRDNSDVYKEEVILFKDPEFGESFVYSALTYRPDELFMTDSYTTTGNVVFSGSGAINERHHAEVSETMLFERNDSFKAIIYKISSNNTTYLCGFYQKEKLVLQFAFPYTEDNVLRGIEKIKEINQALNLNIDSWNRIKAEELEINENPKSFWENPYLGIYLGEYMLNDLEVKIKNTQFKRLYGSASREKEPDYLFFYEHDNEKYEIAFKREKTELSKKQYSENFETTDFIPVTYTNKKLYIIKEKSVGGQIEMDTEMYFKNNSILKIQITYPEKDTKAKEQILDILTNLRIRML